MAINMGGRIDGKLNSATVNSVVNLNGFSMEFILDSNIFRPLLEETIQRKSIPLQRFMQVATYKSDLQNGGAKEITMMKKNRIVPGGFVDEDKDLVSQSMSFETVTFGVKEAGNVIQISEFAKRTSFVDLVSEMAESLAKDITLVYEMHLRDTALTGGAGTPTVFARKSINDPRPTTQADVTSALNVTTLKDAKELLAVNDVAPFYDGNFVLICHSHQYRDLTDDPQFVDVTNYQDKVNLYQGELGKLQNVRIIDSNLIWNGSTVPNDYYKAHKATLVKGVAGNKADLYQCVLLSDGYLGYAEAMAPNLRAGTDSNLGRRESLGWLSIWGATILNEENGVIIISA